MLINTELIVLDMNLFIDLLEMYFINTRCCASELRTTEQKTTLSSWRYPKS